MRVDLENLADCARLLLRDRREEDEWRLSVECEEAGDRQQSDGEASRVVLV